ncbi:DNA mismatch repair protein MutS [Seleniivibrio woodruffii]|uniref:DNA mismatch repair protein MutS n=1 Tax=Seleniivibrio woodruffii TaxID=1078050 RepID=UPI0026EC56D3|nr:DNA mismatch repair protein MutS [Seleniivibrio woodruffii]
MSKPEKITPMMQQFYEMKEKHQGSLLFFRMGDFYEMFGEDAVTASKILGIALTSREKDKENGMPMCGVPHHSYQAYLVKLLKAGLNVAICDQLEDPAQAKGIVKRGVTKVMTPGTVVDEAALPASDNNFFACIYKSDKNYRLAFADSSTGEIYLEPATEETVKDIIARYSPKETVRNFKVTDEADFSFFGTFSESLAQREVAEYYSVAALKSLGIDDNLFACPVYMAIRHLQRVMLDVKLLKPRLVTDDERVYLDSVASSTLELVKNSRDGGEENTLFSVLNHTQTTMGSRLLKKWLLNPLRNVENIRRRQEITEFFINRQDTADGLRNQLSEVYDVERIATRIGANRCNAKDLVWLKNSTKTFPIIKYMLESCDNPLIAEMAAGFDALDDLTGLIDGAIDDNPPMTLMDGGLIRAGYNAEVDELRDIKDNSKNILMKIEAREKSATGISTLRVKYNKVFGYYIEVSKGALDKVPYHYVRKQTIVNGERYIIPELKELEDKILNADSRLFALEYEIFTEIRLKIAENAQRIRNSASVAAELDVLLSFAKAAVKNNYVKPHVTDSDAIIIKDGRHPVVERNIRNGYVPNDVEMNTADSRLSIITGPNMAGKSTYLRMCALITMMAHTGSFVPAASAEIGLVDRIFTRVGASDNLAGGESTFMVEMVETSNILNNATEKSLLILDEIGRGTSTFDGVSIAWSIAEYIADKVKAKTLFATHYHEMTDIAMTNAGVKNLATQVLEHKGELIFMRKVIEGTADKSYGIHVAELAGLPKKVVKRSYEILKNLEKNELSPHGIVNTPRSGKDTGGVVQTMLVFDDHPVVDELRKLDLNSITPLMALNVLAAMKEKADKE